MSDTSYESDDGEWHPPMMNDETGELHSDVYGTLTETASTITTPEGVSRRFLEMIGPEKAKSIHTFLDIGCGKGIVVSTVAKTLSCKAIGIDILEEQLIQAREETIKNGVEEACTFVCDDFLRFADHVNDVNPKLLLIYMYLIPKMVSNRELREKVVELIEKGATFVTWSYHASPSWPELFAEDETFGIKIFQKK